ncbi:MAG TPA: creatininase family protein [Pseudonocardia sp.]|uniref:creatininase family protein n=1 Tax=Pseudonocardia sp. TaxID=60912 RepID=UPI002B4B8827|nr:creatininase family protein [Pseudonocardia sp.]HLU56077.1 creatininase family protein [Pseudonocardia sp.]
MSTLHDLTTTEFAALSPRPRVALIPVGATEQHGPNLAMGVDWRIAEAIARRVAATLSPTAVATPALPFGLSGHHMDFPGTISIGADAFRAVLTDVARSLRAHGITKVVFVNGHRGNENVLGVLITELAYQHGIEAASTFWMTQAADAIARHRVTRRWGHACEIETSVAMALTADLVRPDALEPGDLIDDYGAFEDNYEPFAAGVVRSFASRTRNGVFGDATRATLEAGTEISTVAIERTTEFVRDFARRPSRLPDPR